MRSERVIKNIIYDYLGNILTILINFILKSVFIYTLGKEYLGLSGLFTNVLAILSLTELGISSAITYELYKPLADKDYKKIHSIMNFYKKAYLLIGIIILVIGLTLLPALKFIVKFDEQIQINYYGIYILFLLNTVISYLFNAHKSTIFYAAQRKYLTKKIEYILTIGQAIAQILSLYLFKNYFLYLIIWLIRTILHNYLVARLANKEYPVLKESDAEPLQKEERSRIFKNVYALALYKISGVVINSTDNIIISAFISTSVLGCYSLYNYLVITIKSVIVIVFESFVAAVGDINATEEDGNKRKIFEVIFFISFLLYGLSAIGLWQVSTVFIQKWAGSEFIMSQWTVLLMAISFLILGLENATYIFRTACGLFNEAKFRPVISAVINLVLSLILVYMIGINGVFIGTIVSRIVTYLTIDPVVVFKKIFKKSVLEYYAQYFVYCLQIAIAGMVCQFIDQTLFPEGWVAVFARTMVCIIVFGLMVFIVYRRDDRFTYLLNKGRLLISRFVPKKGSKEN